MFCLRGLHEPRGVGFVSLSDHYRGAQIIVVARSLPELHTNLMDVLAIPVGCRISDTAGHLSRKGHLCAAGHSKSLLALAVLACQKFQKRAMHVQHPGFETG